MKEILALWWSAVKIVKKVCRVACTKAHHTVSLLIIIDNEIMIIDNVIILDDAQCLSDLQFTSSIFNSNSLFVWRKSSQQSVIKK